MWDCPPPTQLQACRAPTPPRSQSSLTAKHMSGHATLCLHSGQFPSEGLVGVWRMEGRWACLPAAPHCSAADGRGHRRSPCPPLLAQRMKGSLLVLSPGGLAQPALTLTSASSSSQTHSHSSILCSCCPPGELFPDPAWWASMDMGSGCEGGFSFSPCPSTKNWATGTA